MLALGLCHRVFVYREPADLRKGFDDLCGLIRSGMKRDPLSDDVYVFINRRWICAISGCNECSKTLRWREQRAGS